MPSGSAIDLTALATQVMMAKGFQPQFSTEVQREVGMLKPALIPQPGLEAKDMRNLLWFSIDNDDSRDLDQLTFAEQLPEGNYKIYVAVAYVDLLVKKGMAIDQHAEHNTTSVYTPTKIFPMLPEQLSTNLTSLNPDQDRVALVFEGTLSSVGVLENSAIYLAYVHNFAQLAYNSVGDWLEGGGMPARVTAVPKLAEQIRLQDTITQILANYRHKFGTLSLETIEAYPEISNGVPIAIEETKRNRARDIIENFMIVANTISGQFAQRNKLMAFRRVVKVPKRWDKIVSIAKELGENLPADPNSIALEQFLVKQKQLNPITFPDLSLTIIKLLGRGEYFVIKPGVPSPGHFGLALRDYTHSTAPNRRFPDLITQRLLIAFLNKQAQPYSEDELFALASHCTQKEDDAEKVERRTRKSAEALVLSSSIGKQFDAIVTGAGPKGTWVRLFTPPVEGKLIKGTENLDVGDRLKVKLVHTDVTQGYIDFIRI